MPSVIITFDYIEPEIVGLKNLENTTISAIRATSRKIEFQVSWPEPEKISANGHVYDKIQI